MSSALNSDKSSISRKSFKHLSNKQYQRSYNNSGVYNLFAIAGRITFIFVKYDRQWVQTFKFFLHCFCSACTHCWA